MTISATSFVVDFPEFSNTTLFPTSSITYWINYASLLVNPHIFGGPGSASPTNPPNNLYDVLLELFTAHNLVLEGQAQQTAAAGGLPGLTTGPISNKHVGPVSVSYNTEAGINPGDGQYNLTIYGTRFINLYKLGGAPGLVVNGFSNPGYNFYPIFGTSPWPGPPLWGVGAWM
jgi:hypothetical protein